MCTAGQRVSLTITGPGLSWTLGNPSGAPLGLSPVILNLPLYFLRYFRGPFRAPKEAHIATKQKFLKSLLGPLQPLLAPYELKETLGLLEACKRQNS